MTTEKILVTAALPYINNLPHMGHFVGSHLPADIYSRYVRSKGLDALFVGGSDEHGTPSAIAAKDLGISPETLVDKLHFLHERIYGAFNISYDIYSRTSSRLHHETVKEFFQRIRKNGFVEQKQIRMYYCENDELFLPDRFLKGTCPTCYYEEANADQCENCTTVLTSDTLVDPYCGLCGEVPIIKESDHLFFSLGSLQDRLESWIEANNGRWRNYVYSEAKGWIRKGLESRSITRDMKWGISVPEFPDKVFYVWFDAPIGYISFVKELGESKYEDYWLNPDAKIQHFLGKDNIPFHTVFWPGMLLAHGGLNLPDNIFGYNYLNFEGQKFSKSKKIGVFAYGLLTSDIEIDALRAYLTTVLPETRDTEFRWEDFMSSTNSELVSKVGNLFNRTLSMVWSYFNGKLNDNDLNALNDADSELIEAIRSMPLNIGNLFFDGEIRMAYRKILEFATQGNIYLSRVEPWNLVKDGREKEARKALHLSLIMCKSLAIVAAPILPTSMQRVWEEQLQLESNVDSPGIWGHSTDINFPTNHQLGPVKPLYKKITKSDLDRYRTHFSDIPSLEEILD